MNMQICSGREYHEATKHSWLSVRQHPNRLDWDHQPAALKFYPQHYPRIPLQKAFASHNFIYHIAGITAKKSYPGVTYYLRTNPSAGALYPNELYFQSRGVEGFEDGIYHFEVGSSSAVLLRAIDASEGLEPLLGRRGAMRGLLFFISSPWYRSAWKYKNRAYRYCLLDAGHLLGAIDAGSYLYGHAYRIVYDFHIDDANRFFGFSEEEFFLSAAMAAVPVADSEEITLPKAPIEPCDATGGIFEHNALIERAYRETLPLRGCKAQPAFPKMTFHPAAWEEAILKRRSTREFLPSPMSHAAYEAILESVAMPVPSDCDEPLQIYSVVNRVEGMEPGIYRGTKRLKSGDFSQKAAYLCLEQKLGGDSGVTFFILSNGCNYRALYQKAGLIGHRIYLVSVYLGLGCSGIGAYYDDEVNDFLDDDGMVLYAVAAGVPKA